MALGSAKKGAVKLAISHALRTDGAELKRELHNVTKTGVMPAGFQDPSVRAVPLCWRLHAFIAQ
jgi:hypothetical protein